MKSLNLAESPSTLKLVTKSFDPEQLKEMLVERSHEKRFVFITPKLCNFKRKMTIWGTTLKIYDMSGYNLPSGLKIYSSFGNSFYDFYVCFSNRKFDKEEF